MLITERKDPNMLTRSWIPVPAAVAAFAVLLLAGGVPAADVHRYLFGVSAVLLIIGLRELIVGRAARRQRHLRLHVLSELAVMDRPLTARHLTAASCANPAAQVEWLIRRGLVARRCAELSIDAYEYTLTDAGRAQMPAPMDPEECGRRLPRPPFQTSCAVVGVLLALALVLTS